MNRGILMSAPMVRALLTGRKTETRRLPRGGWGKLKEGDWLYVKETWYPSDSPSGGTWFRADWPIEGTGPLDVKWNPSLFMPEARTRIRLRVLYTLVQPLHEITPNAALCEGVGSIEAYRDLWNTLHTKPGTRWVDNPDVVVISFQRG